tara:strand:+ start:259 stop:441 length:183 start_codon:yes stop_codon:yes gene_type:complete
MNTLETKNALVNEISNLKEKLKNAEFMERMALKDEIFELEKKVEKIEIKGENNDCEICRN